MANMRISTNVLFDTGINRISEMQARLAQTQNQISTGRRILTPADDPVAAAQALLVSQSQSANEQLSLNRQNANHALSLEETALQSVTSLMQDVKTLIVGAGNGTLDNTQRAYYAAELEGIFNEMLGLANSSDGAGNYLFAGYQSTVQPFSKTATGAQYGGDQGQRMAQIGASRQIATGDSGSAIFERNKTGNGTFVAAAATANTGSGIVSSGSIVDAAALTGHNYEVTFTVASDVTTYEIVDNSTVPATTLPGGPFDYKSGQAITFDGLQFDVKGEPANGDSFVVEPSKNQSVFTTLTNLIAVLNQPAGSDAGKAQLANGLSEANNNISNALDNVLTTRASVGIRLKEIESLNTQGDDLDLQYQQQLEDLQGLDYAKAISDLAKQKLILEAAQQAFVKTSGMSLFDFI
jgi:flagellar hook-associated protein 3 FlgL